MNKNEELQKALKVYIDARNNQDKCSGFIDGFEVAFELLSLKIAGERLGRKSQSAFSSDLFGEDEPVLIKAGDERVLLGPTRKPPSKDCRVVSEEHYQIIISILKVRRTMKKVVAKLMDFGMDFEYENRGSRGEVILSYELDLRVSTQDGKIYFSYRGESEEYPDDEKYMDYVVSLVEDACIEETT